MMAQFFSHFSIIKQPQNLLFVSCNDILEPLLGSMNEKLHVYHVTTSLSLHLALLKLQDKIYV